MTTNNKKRIVVVGNPAKDQTRRLGSELLGWLAGRARVVAHNIDADLDLAHLPDADFVLVFGGDGTILSTVRALGENQLPVIGVNIGKLGFLAEFSVDLLKRHFDRITTDPDCTSRRTMLACRVVSTDSPEFNSIAVNELAVIAGPPFRMLEVSVSVGDEHLALCAGDGLIVATPTGSTAYNLSAGGPILAATLDAAVITPLAAHSLAFRPIVVNLDKPIVLRWRSNRRTAKVDNQTESDDNQVVVAIDGQENTPLGSRDQVILTPARARFHLVHNPEQSQWSLLNTKLHWGAMPNYQDTDR